MQQVWRIVKMMTTFEAFICSIFTALIFCELEYMLMWVLIPNEKRQQLESQVEKIMNEDLED